jgi:hypothetical protein
LKCPGWLCSTAARYHGGAACGATTHSTTGPPSPSAPSRISSRIVRPGAPRARHRTTQSALAADQSERVDSDGDGIPDTVELMKGTDPSPPANDCILPLGTTVDAASGRRPKASHGLGWAPPNHGGALGRQSWLDTGRRHAVKIVSGLRGRPGAAARSRGIVEAPCSASRGDSRRLCPSRANG